MRYDCDVSLCLLRQTLTAMADAEGAKVHSGFFRSYNNSALRLEMLSSVLEMMDEHPGVSHWPWGTATAAEPSPPHPHPPFPRSHFTRPPLAPTRHAPRLAVH